MSLIRLQSYEIEYIGTNKCFYQIDNISSQNKKLKYPEKRLTLLFMAALSAYTKK